jgi:hypothetical protein
MEMIPPTILATMRTEATAVRSNNYYDGAAWVWTLADYLIHALDEIDALRADHLKSLSTIVAGSCYLLSIFSESTPWTSVYSDDNLLFSPYVHELVSAGRMRQIEPGRYVFVERDRK